MLKIVKNGHVQPHLSLTNDLTYERHQIGITHCFLSYRQFLRGSCSSYLFRSAISAICMSTNKRPQCNNAIKQTPQFLE